MLKSFIDIKITVIPLNIKLHIKSAVIGMQMFLVFIYDIVKSTDRIIAIIKPNNTCNQNYFDS